VITIDAARGSGIASNYLHVARGGKDRVAGAPAGQTRCRWHKALPAGWQQLGYGRELLGLGTGSRVRRRGGYRGASVRHADGTGARQRVTARHGTVLPDAR
jgi:hypothetical protein